MISLGMANQERPVGPRDPGPGPAEAKPLEPYEPPRLTRVGSLYELLGKTGFAPDVGHPHKP